VLVLFHHEPTSDDPKILRWPRAHLLWPLGLQIRGRAAARRAGRSSSFTPRPTAGYGWEVVARFLGARAALRESWPPASARFPAPAGCPREAGERLLGLAGKTVGRAVGRIRKKSAPSAVAWPATPPTPRQLQHDAGQPWRCRWRRCKSIANLPAWPIPRWSQCAL